MNIPISYDTHPVPSHLTPFIRRILAARLQDDTTATIPARPTGNCYFGCVPAGQARASARGRDFEISKDQLHFSGQLTTFDAEYTLIGPAHHILAECTPTGGYRLLQRDLAALANQQFLFDRKGSDLSGIDGFLAVLSDFARSAGPEEAVIAEAADRIEQAQGNLSISALACDLGLGDRQFHRQFSKIVGMSPKSFAVVRRVVFALGRLAVDPAPPIADVAAEAGFSDQAHLTKYFKRFMGMTPARVELDDDGVLKTIVLGS